MSNIEYKNLIWELGGSWKFRNELRMKLQDKVKEIINLQKRYVAGEINQINYKIESFILNKEKDLLAKLFKKEDARVWNLKK